jgi:hypothetical protein
MNPNDAPRGGAPHLESWRSARGRPDRPSPTGEELERHKAALERANWPTLPKLSHEEHAELEAIFDKVVADHNAKVGRHVARLQRAACSLGVRVARHEVTLEDATRRLDSIIAMTDPDSEVPIVLLSYRDGMEIAKRAFLSAFDMETRR